MKTTQNDKDRNVIFLDIDGVLQPINSQIRHEVSKEERENLPSKLAKELNNPVLLTCHLYDVAAVYYDWDKESVQLLKDVLEFGKTLKNEIELVIVSSWRESNSFEQLKALFQIHDLHSYITDVVPPMKTYSKTEDLATFFSLHPDVNKFVIIEDDTYVNKYYPEHAIFMMKHKFEKEDAEKTIEYFKKVN